jgi:hypothetical protein
VGEQHIGGHGFAAGAKRCDHQGRNMQLSQMPGVIGRRLLVNSALSLE